MSLVILLFEQFTDLYLRRRLVPRLELFINFVCASHGEGRGDGGGLKQFIVNDGQYFLNVGTNED